MQYLVFSLLGDAFALPLDLVVTIRPTQDSGAEPPLELRHHFFGDSLPPAAPGEVAVLRLGDRQLAVKVDAIEGVRDLDPVGAWPLPPAVLDEQAPQSRGLRGLLKDRERWILLLGDEAFLTPSNAGGS